MFLASLEIHKQFHHFDSGQDASNSDTFNQLDVVAPFKTLYGYSDTENNNDSTNNNIDEARYNLATRIMSNGVEVIIASDKTKTPDHIAADITNSQLKYNKPMTLAASTIKNQMMILLFPTSSYIADDSLLVNQSQQKLNYNLPFHSNHFITKTCLTTYTYRTTYVQGGHTTVESREKVISNIATEERNYPKITPTQTVGVTLTKTPELAVGTFPTTYSYFNTFRDNSDNLQLMTSEYTVVNTITGPNDYVAYLQPTSKATPALKTNTYYSEVTLSEKIKSTMYTVKRNLTQVVVTKSHIPTHSSAVVTSYYAYDGNSLEDVNGSSNSITTSVTTNKGDKEVAELNDENINMLDDIHIYATKTFLTTFTYYTTTVLNGYLTENSQTESGTETMSTVFNYYTRVIENVITDTVPPNLLSNELLTKMKIELRKRKPNQRLRLIVTTATLKDGQTVKISAMEMYKGILGPAQLTITPTLSNLMSLSPQCIADKLNHSYEKLEDQYSVDDDEAPNSDFQPDESANLSSLENLKRPENQGLENNNAISALPSEQILAFVEVPSDETSIANMSVAINNDKPSNTAANQLLQRLTALKPMFSAMADLLQNNFGVTRDNIKPIKNIESKQASNKKINSSVINSTVDTNHPIYIPVPNSALRKSPYEHSNYTEFIPQSLHIKPPLLLEAENSFETIENDETKIIPVSTFRRDQLLHNGGIYIRPGEIITANSDVIIGKPNGIDYVEIPNHLRVDKNTSQAYSLDNGEFQVTFYHNKIQHPYKQKSTFPLTSNTHKSQNIPLNDNKLSPQPALDLRPPSEQHFDKNILKPPPLLPPSKLQSPIPIHSQQGLSLILSAPDKPARTGNKKQTATNTYLSAEATSLLYLHSPSPLTPPLPQKGTPNVYNLNQELRNNEILEIQKIPQIFSANLKPNSMQSPNFSEPSHITRKPQSQLQIYSSHIKANMEQSALNWKSAQEPQIRSSYMRLQPKINNAQTGKDSSKLSPSSNWQNGREPQTKTSILSSFFHKDQKTKTNQESSLVWRFKNVRQPQIGNQFSSQINEEHPTSTQKYVAFTSTLPKRPQASTVSTKLADMEIFYKGFPSTPIAKFTLNPSSSPVPLPNKENENRNQINNYSSDSATKNHQNISLDQHIFSHTVDMNVPPLTFNREDNDYPKQALTDIRGQISPASVNELKSPTDNSYKYMPLITIPANEQQVQVSLTPLNSIGALPMPLEEEPSWNGDAANKDNSNSIVRKISLLNNNFKLFANDEDQNTFPTNKILNTKPKPEASSNWKQHRRQHLHNYSHFNNSQQFLTTTKPSLTALPQTEVKKSETEPYFKSKQNQQHTRLTGESSIHYTANTKPTVQVSTYFKHPSLRLTQLQSTMTITTQLPQVQVGDSKWLVSQKHNQNNNSERPKHMYPSREQQQIHIYEKESKVQNQPKKVSVQKIHQNASNKEKTPQTTTSTKFSKTTTTTQSGPTPEDINTIISSNKIVNDPKPLMTYGEPFTKEISVVRHKQNKTASIFLAPGEAFRASTKRQNANIKIATKAEPQPSGKNKVIFAEPDPLIKEIFDVRETQYPSQHIEKTLTKGTTTSKPSKIDPMPSTLKTNAATTESVLGLHPHPAPAPLSTSANPNPASKSLLPSYSLSSSNKITPKRQPNITNIGISPEQIKPRFAEKVKIANKNLSKIDKHLKDHQNITTIETMNIVEVIKSENSLNLSAHSHETNPEYFENGNRKPNESFKFLILQPSESYEHRPITTTTYSPAASIKTFTTTTTTTIKRMVLPTKYITNKHTYTVTTTTTVPPIPSKSLQVTTEKTGKVTTLFLTHTKINTIVDTVTSVKTLEPITVTATTTLRPSSTFTEFTSPQSHLPVTTNQVSSFSSTESQMLDINQDLTYLPYPSVEVVSTNITQNSDLDPNENRIFIIMTNNKNKKSTVANQYSPSQRDQIPEDAEDSNTVAPTDGANEVMIEYDNGISFDDIHIRDENPSEIVSGKSVESSAFINHLDSVKESSSDDHVILGGVLVATPPKLSTKNHINESINVGCHSKCKAARNEHCGVVDNHWSCLCRPGFARMFPDRPCKPTYTYDLLIHAERVGNYPLQYISELRNNKTEHYKHLSQLVNNALDRMIMQSDFRDAYHGVEVTNFAEGDKNHQGILVKVLLQLSDNSNEKRLENVFKKNLRLSNYSIGGTDLYTNKAGVHALTIKDFNECLSRKLHDCSENAHCFNLPGTYTCSCVEGFVDLSDNPIYPGRMCSSEQIGCDMCHYHGKCSLLVANSNDRNFCECFPWYAGSKCQVNLKILLIVLLGIGTLLFILLLFCILITCTKRRNHLKHTVLAPSTVTSSSEGLHINSRLTANMVIGSVGLRSSLQGVSLKNNKRQKTIKIDKRSMIKDSSSETSQNSLPYSLKNSEPTGGSCNKKKNCPLKHSKKYRNSGSQVNTTEQYSISVPTSIQMENQSDLNTVITTSSSFKRNNKQAVQQSLLGNTNEYEAHYCEQSDRSLTVMIPRAKYHSSVLSQPQLMHHQLTMERVHKTSNSDNINKSVTVTKQAESKRNQKKNLSTKREFVDEKTRIEIPSNSGALISAGFEVSAIVGDNKEVTSPGERHNDMARFDSLPPNYTLITTSEPETSLNLSPGRKHLLYEERQQYTSNKNVPSKESEYNVYKCEKELIETMDEWLGNVKLNELSAEARSFDETTIRASTKPVRLSVDENQTQQSHDEANTMAERDLDSTFLLPHTHLYKPDRVIIR